MCECCAHIHACLYFKAKAAAADCQSLGHCYAPLIQTLNGTHTHIHQNQWRSLNSAHRLAYLTSQVLLYSRGGRVSRSVKALIFFCQAMSQNKNMPNTCVGLLGTQPSKKKNKIKKIGDKQTNKKNRAMNR